MIDLKKAPTPIKFSQAVELTVCDKWIKGFTEPRQLNYYAQDTFLPELKTGQMARLLKVGAEPVALLTYAKVGGHMAPAVHSGSDWTQPDGWVNTARYAFSHYTVAEDRQGVRALYIVYKGRAGYPGMALRCPDSFLTPQVINFWYETYQKPKP